MSFTVCRCRRRHRGHREKQLKTQCAISCIWKLLTRPLNSGRSQFYTMRRISGSLGAHCCYLATRWRLVSARDLTNVVTVTNQTNTHCKYYNFNLYYITRKVTKYSVLVASKWLRDLKGSIMNEFHMWPFNWVSTDDCGWATFFELKNFEFKKFINPRVLLFNAAF